MKKQNFLVSCCMAVIAMSITGGAFAQINNKSFLAKVMFTCAEQPDQSLAADIDGDGKKDIITISQFSHTISIFQNLIVNAGDLITTSSFSSKKDIDCPVLCIAIADVNKDQKPDIIGSGTDGLYIFQNNCTPGNLSVASFTKIVLPFSGSGADIDIKDVDGDGNPDILLQAIGQMLIWRNKGNSGNINQNFFETPFSLQPMDGNPYMFDLQDLDNDGKPDLAVGNRTKDNISIYRNTATPGIINSSSFDTVFKLPAQFDPADVVIEDIDGDGKKDITVAHGTGQKISIYKNKFVSGVLNASSFEPRFQLDSKPGAASVVFSDIDHDGKNDMIADNGSSFLVFKNKSIPGTIDTSTFETSVPFLTNNYISYYLVTADLNNDSTEDVIMTFNKENSGTKYSNKIGIFQNKLSLVTTSVPVTSKHQIVSSAHPNPFREEALIHYFMEQRGNITISLFDQYGKLVSTLHNDVENEGDHDLKINNVQSGLTSGMYYVTLQTATQSSTVKLIYME